MRKTSSKKWQLIFIDAAQQHNGGNNDPIKPNDMLVKYNCRHKAIGGLMKWVIRQLHTHWRERVRYFVHKNSIL